MIRLATASDAPALAALAAATFPLACPPGNTVEAIQGFIETHLSEARFDGYLADPARAVLVGGDFAAYAMLVFEEPADADVATAITARPTVELSKCYVRAGDHGTGLAAELMTASIELARSRGVAGVWLGVNEHNARANRFYEKHGFERVGAKKFFLGDHWEDDYVRELILT
jgi:ribosomal protein S18 acetylase RimI-like enzyme